MAEYLKVGEMRQIIRQVNVRNHGATEAPYFRFPFGNASQNRDCLVTVLDGALEQDITRLYVV